MFPKNPVVGILRPRFPFKKDCSLLTSTASLFLPFLIKVFITLHVEVDVITLDTGVPEVIPPKDDPPKDDPPPNEGPDDPPPPETGGTGVVVVATGAKATQSESANPVRKSPSLSVPAAHEAAVSTEDVDIVMVLKAVQSESANPVRKSPSLSVPAAHEAAVSIVVVYTKTVVSQSGSVTPVRRSPSLSVPARQDADVSTDKIAALVVTVNNVDSVKTVISINVVFFIIR